MMGKIPQGITEQGMSFQKTTSTYHRSRKMRKQRGGALAPAPYESLGEVLPASMTGPMTTAASGVAGGSATGPLDLALSQTRQAVQQFGGGKRSRKQNRNRQQQNRNRQLQNRNRQQQKRNRSNRNRNRQQQNRSRKQKQRGGALGHLKPLSLADAIPASGNYTLLSSQELKAAGLSQQWSDENQVNPNFGGALTVPGGK